MKKQLWSARFGKSVNSAVLKFTESITFDNRLYSYDIEGSIAHAKMLNKVGLISKPEFVKIEKTLNRIKKEIEEGKFAFSLELEDIHMNIEACLIKRLGKTGQKLHTGRSRNDQIALDMRMYVRDKIKHITGLLANFQESIVDVAEKNIDAVMPGMTHLQHGQPVLFSHHVMAYFWMAERNKNRLCDLLKRVNVLPLGSGALSGTTLPLDRDYVAKLLGFDSVTENSMDAVSDRDFVIEMLSCMSLIAMHLSRFSEEIVLWTTKEFSFVDIDECYCTGSSLMPQKKNPDVLELVRGKTGRVYGDLIAVLVAMKGLPLSYNRDMQEDKEPLFDAVDNVSSCLAIITDLIANVKINKKKMEDGLKNDFSFSTDLAEYLVKKNVPFRSAYGIVGRLVSYCISAGKGLMELTVAELKGFSEKFGPDAIKLFSPQASVNAKKIKGGTSRLSVLAQIKKARGILCRK